MTQEDKELLFKELSKRLPYGVIIKTPDNNAHLIGLVKRLGFIKGKDYIDVITDKNTYPIEHIKPYFRPISSMTEEEVDKLFQILKINEDSDSGKEWLKVNDVGIIRLFTEVGKDFYEIDEAFDYLYSIHIDYCWICEKNLAIEVTEENNPYENC